MPIYDYACTVCGQVTEVIHGVYAPGPKFCPNCGAEDSLKKAINAPAIHYRGSGWAKKDRSATSSPGRSRTAGKDGDGGSASDGGGPSDGDSSGKTSDGDGKSSTATSPSTSLSSSSSSAVKPAAPASGSGSSKD